MQASPPPPIKLHWIPVQPSWLVAIGLVLLAALPHQIPATGRRLLENPIGSLLFAALGAVVWWHHPVLGTAMLLLVAALRLRHYPRAEGFSSQILIRDRVSPKRQRWLQEEVMMEEPHFIQERTQDSGFILDRVSDEEAKPWFVESTLEESTLAIQERLVRPADSSEVEYECGARAALQ